MQTKWKVVPFNTNYEVSSCGKVRRKKDKYLINPRKDKYGYITTRLSKNGKKTNYGIHRLVLLTFRPRPDAKDYHAHHINFDTADNRLQNLEWYKVRRNMRTQRRRKETICNSFTLFQQGFTLEQTLERLTS